MDPQYINVYTTPEWLKSTGGPAPLNAEAARKTQSQQYRGRRDKVTFTTLQAMGQQTKESNVQQRV